MFGLDARSKKYIAANHWLLVNQAKGDGRYERILDTKARSEAATLEALRFFDVWAPVPHVNLQTSPLKMFRRA